jgi:hypothetical protein
MVDPVLTEQKNIDVKVDTNNKSDKKRRVRRQRKGNRENVPKADAPIGEQRTQRDQNGARPARRQRAPRVANDSGPQEKEKADYTDGTLRLKISLNRPRTAYTRLVRLMLAGYDGAGNALEGLKKPIDTVEVSALGNAIGSAIFVADNLMKGKVLVQSQALVDYVNFESSETEEDRPPRGSPRILLTLSRLPSWAPKEDEVLKKTKVFRTKVLGLPEDA